MAFIVDIRRENRDLHLLYKALFELSADRADFVSRLFSRPRPAGLASTASVEDIFARYAAVPPSPELFAANAALVRERLLTTRGLPLSQTISTGSIASFKAFYADGPEIQFWGSRDVDAVQPSYRQLMTAKDLSGQSRSFLATEDGFRVRQGSAVEEHDRPGGRRLRRARRASGASATTSATHGDVVHAFYGSNVGVYLTKRQTRAFCGEPRQPAGGVAAPGSSSATACDRSPRS